MLLPFPTERKDHERRKIFIRNVARKTADNKNWQPKSYSRICSLHFPDGGPTEQNPYPVLHVGHCQTRTPSGRRSIVKHDILPPKKRRKLSSEICTESNDVETIKAADIKESKCTEISGKPLENIFDHDYTTYTFECDCQGQCCLGCHKN